MKENEEDARSQATELLETVFRHGISLPVNLDSIVRSINAYVFCRKMPVEISGFIYPPIDDIIHYLIGVNSTKPRSHQKFTVAHEIGHILNGDCDGLITLSSVINRTGDILRIERRANIFASELLMPEFHVHYNITRKGIKDISELCRIFDVSRAAMEIRLFKELGYDREDFSC